MNIVKRYLSKDTPW